MQNKYNILKNRYQIREMDSYLKTRLSDPSKVAHLFQECLKFLDDEREHFISLSVDTKNQLKSIDIISIGSLNMSIVHPREVFFIAVHNRAAAIIVGHNHPSGDPSPSQNDIDITRKLSESGKILGIEMLDHIIFSHDKFISLKEENLIY